MCFIFDESDAVNECVLWLRHDGSRRCLAGGVQHPLTLNLDGTSTSYAAFHMLRPSGNADSDLFVEKMEFTLDSRSFQSLLNSDVVTLELTTLLGTAEKKLIAEQCDAIRSFDSRVRSRHTKAKSAHRPLLSLVGL